MGFEILNFENYERKEHFLHYLNNVSCSYSISVDHEKKAIYINIIFF